jgi:cytochrome c oxidase assembly factor CtaG
MGTNKKTEKWDILGFHLKYGSFFLSFFLFWLKIVGNAPVPRAGRGPINSLCITVTLTVALLMSSCQFLIFIAMALHHSIG